MAKKSVSPELKAAKARLKEVEASLKLVTEEADAAEREYKELCLGRHTWLQEKRKAELELEKLLPLKKRAAAMLKEAISRVDRGGTYVFYYNERHNEVCKLEQLGYVSVKRDASHIYVTPTEAGRKKAAES